MARNLPEDLWKRVAIGAPDQCWPFLGRATTKGYGQFMVDGQRRAAHRLAYELPNGPIPEGMVIDHLCRNRACCNPAHLEVVTPRENTLRGEGIAAKRHRATYCQRGHEFTPENTRVFGPDRRWRACKRCARMTPADRAVRASDGCNGPFEDPDFRAPARQAVAGIA